MEIKTHECLKNQGVANYLNASERSSIKRTGNNSLGLVSMTVLDDTSEICAVEIQVESNETEGWRTDSCFEKCVYEDGRV